MSNIIYLKIDLDIIDQGIIFHGEKAQQEIAIEEMAELVVQICKKWRRKSTSKEEKEEAADAIITIITFLRTANISVNDLNEEIQRKQKIFKGTIIS